MVWREAKELGIAWAEKNLSLELRGQVLQLVKFESDGDSRFFYGDRTADTHYQITSAIAREARKRGAKTNYATISQQQYWEWLEVQGKEDNDATRLAFIESCHHLSQA